MMQLLGRSAAFLLSSSLFAILHEDFDLCRAARRASEPSSLAERVWSARIWRCEAFGLLKHLGGETVSQMASLVRWWIQSSQSKGIEQTNMDTTAQFSDAGHGSKGCSTVNWFIWKMLKAHSVE